MHASQAKMPQVLNLRTGELVEVRNKDEILATLDHLGRLDSLPFMPEMLQYCGKRFRVFKRAHKTCDTIEKTGGRRMTNAVHLEGVRCDGTAHGGCQAGCLIFWKEAWLKRVSDKDMSAETASFADSICTEEKLRTATRRAPESSGPQEEIFVCQATELRRATSELAWWDIRQYINDVRSGNVGLGDLVRALLFWLFTKALRVGACRALLFSYNSLQRIRGGCLYPFYEGKLSGPTPDERLDLKPGELVQVKTYDEILGTVNRRRRNRGLSFDPEMVPYCEGTFRVLRRVEKIINEKTGRMMTISNDCVILDGVTCTAQYSQKRLFCPRSIYPFWREIWLRRAP